MKKKALLRFLEEQPDTLTVWVDTPKQMDYQLLMAASNYVSQQVPFAGGFNDPMSPAARRAGDAECTERVMRLHRLLGAFGLSPDDFDLSPRERAIFFATPNN